MRPKVEGHPKRLHYFSTGIGGLYAYRRKRRVSSRKDRSGYNRVVGSKRAVTSEARALIFQRAIGWATQSIITAANGSTISFVLAGDITTNPLPTSSSNNLKATLLHETFPCRPFALTTADASSLVASLGNPDPKSAIEVIPAQVNAFAKEWA